MTELTIFEQLLRINFIEVRTNPRTLRLLQQILRAVDANRSSCTLAVKQLGSRNNNNNPPSLSLLTSTASMPVDCSPKVHALVWPSCGLWDSVSAVSQSIRCVDRGLDLGPVAACMIVPVPFHSPPGVVVGAWTMVQGENISSAPYSKGRLMGVCGKLDNSADL